MCKKVLPNYDYPDPGPDPGPNPGPDPGTGRQGPPNGVNALFPPSFVRKKV